MILQTRSLYQIFVQWQGEKSTCTSLIAVKKFNIRIKSEE